MESTFHRRLRPRATAEEKHEHEFGARVATTKLGDVAGWYPAEPYQTPPDMLPNFIAKFEEGLAEYGTAPQGDQGSQDTPNYKGKGKAKAIEPDEKQQQGESSSSTAAPPAPLLPAAEIREKAKTKDVEQRPPLEPDLVKGILGSTFVYRPPDTSSKVSTKSLGPLEDKDRKRSRSEGPDEDTSDDPEASSQPEPKDEQKKSRTISQTGIRTLPASAFPLWTANFPGNTPELGPIFTGWHHAMTTLYRQYTDNVMDVHPFFPYAPSRPVFIPLLSVSFWDTSEEPHSELRFIGPDDVSSILYAETDTFLKDDDTAQEDPSGTVNTAQEDPSGMIGTAEEETSDKFDTVDEDKRGRYITTTPKEETRNMDMRSRNERGEGRWCYIHIHGKPAKGDQPGVDPPSLMLAWPATCITQKIDDMYHISVDDTDAPTASSASASASSSSMGPPPPPGMYHNVNRTTPLYKALREATSTTLPPPITTSSDDSSGTATQNRELLVRRITYMFQKKGRIPLIQAFRTDVLAWKEFLNAVSSGSGKIFLNHRMPWG